ncbi:MAG: hypothetical protein HY046_12290 [Acidobacteria bacterium]|nr:hypothetical protein [Acidobacteriota bacterium]
MRRTFQFVAAVLILTASVSAQVWRSMGPPGGDVRVLAADPRDARRLFLGTSDGHIFGSQNGGERWELLGRAGAGQDGVITAIVVDAQNPSLLWAALWARDDVSHGGVFRSEDGGQTWAASGLAGQSVRALAHSASRTTPSTTEAADALVAGTLEGVFRSRDNGKTWERISPEGHEEIRNIDSVAIDPKSPDIIYAGTFHLPWKTVNGGKDWQPIHNGMIDDSDVMAIAIDHKNPRRVYASACSGIYRSDNGGTLWKKIQGIPFSARRTQVIVQHASRPELVYAGTTEGLWRTTDGGTSWLRVTPEAWVVNALTLDPVQEGRIVMGTEQFGVMVSDDGGRNFRTANDGFNHRQIVALALDREHPTRVMAVLANAPEPVLATDDGGQRWSPVGPGLNLQALRKVYAAPDTWWAALEKGGLVRYDPVKKTWATAGTVSGEAAASKDKRGRILIPPKPIPLKTEVTDMAFAHNTWFAATPGGLLASRDSGATWSLFPVGPLTTLSVRGVRVSPDGREIRVVSLRGMVFSHDAGATWTWHDLPFDAGGAQRLEVADENTLLATSPKGLYISRDAGRTWLITKSGLPETPIQDLAVIGDVFLCAMQTRGLYLSADRGKTWDRIGGTLAEGFFPVVISRYGGEIIFAASASEGLYAIEMKASQPGRAAGSEQK